MESIVDCPFSIQQVNIEFLPLLEEYKQLSSKKNILEIGIYQGGSLYYWMKYADPFANIFGIDVGIPTEIINRLQDYCSRFNEYKYLSIIKMDSNNIQVVKELEKYSFDFLFIDGGHKYETVLYDFNTYAPLVRKGGLIALHDINNSNYPSFGVKKLWQEIKRTGYETKEIINLKEEVGGIGIIYP